MAQITLKEKVNETVENIAWTVKAYAYQPFTFRKSLEWVLAHECSYEGCSSNHKWAYYTCNEKTKRFPEGYTVKVPYAINHAYCEGKSAALAEINKEEM